VSKIADLVENIANPVKFFTDSTKEPGLKKKEKFELAKAIAGSFYM
jgi:hypothetical protein